MKRRTTLTAAVLALLTMTSAAGCAGGPPRDDGQSGNGLVPVTGTGKPAGGLFSQYPPGSRAQVAALRGETLDGTQLDTAGLAGQVVVVNFWASWCAPCRAEAGELNTSAVATRDLGVRFVGVNVRDGRDAAKSFVEGREEYPSLYDPAGKVVLGFAKVAPNTIPATVILDRQSRVAAVLRRAVTANELTPLIQKVAAEEPAGE